MTPTEKIIALIRIDGRPKAELARKCGMAYAQFYKVANGRKTDLQVSTVGRILTALRLDWDALDDEHWEEANGRL